MLMSNTGVLLVLVLMCIVVVAAGAVAAWYWYDRQKDSDDDDDSPSVPSTPASVPSAPASVPSTPASVPSTLPSWKESGTWSACSKTVCGEGEQTMAYVCSGEKCTGTAPAPKKQTCKVKDCTWNTTNWSECTKPCGGGTRTRTVTCESGTDRDCVLADRPANRQACNEQACTYTFRLDPVRTEEKPCRTNLPGTQSGTCARKALYDCVRQGATEKVMNSFCEGLTRPPDTIACECP
jgi:hypothetical protein